MAAIFGQWWILTGHKIDYKNECALAAWDAAILSMDKNLNSAELITAIDDNCEVVSQNNIQWINRAEVVEIINSLSCGETNTTKVATVKHK